MKLIDANTKIGALIKADPRALDVIAGISDHFKKLYNPVLRRIFASRVTIAEAARIGKVDVDVFFDRLKALGFVVQQKAQDTKEMYTDISLKHDRRLDVRSDIEAGNDPFRKIMKEVNALQSKEILLLINSFEPSPLIRILNERGFQTSVLVKSSAEVHTFIWRNEEGRLSDDVSPTADFDKVLNDYADSMQQIDVRSLPMPQPMMTILSRLETLDVNEALFVYHKKVPVFLLEELRNRKMAYVWKKTADGVHLIIYHKKD